ncbi:hypothetical protein ACN27F_21625 [Solwaraspora sp. WMMB335]|uniref:hypothetical protein n=1 Tax=Solwaraspora sp. WMMB335 TaxID=3404118 RepID=UPI003B9510AE
MSVEDVKAAIVEANTLLARAREAFLGATEVAADGKSIAGSSCYDSAKSEVAAAESTFKSAVDEIDRAVRRFDSAIQLASEYRGKI